jgi:23S rRNA pseudouridine1911/1915/1917 synthase
MPDRGDWEVPGEAAGEALSSFVRARTRAPWSRVKGWIASGKVFVGGAAERGAGRRLRAGDLVSLRMEAPRPRGDRPSVAIVFEDDQVAVIDKPAGVSSVPYEDGERDTAMDLLRDAWRLRRTRRATAPIFVVHRLDRATSGLMVFALTRPAERTLARQFREHTAHRTYLCVAHGAVGPARIESYLVGDRGDRLRGSSRTPGRRGKRAVTHVRPLQPLAEATLCEVRLETGRTHQIRIHLSERGHPVVGDRVYTRDRARSGAPVLPARRLLLHAATLAFVHPATGEALRFEAPIPADMGDEIEALGGSRV